MLNKPFFHLLVFCFIFTGNAQSVHDSLTFKNNYFVIIDGCFPINMTTSLAHDSIKIETDIIQAISTKISIALHDSYFMVKLNRINSYPLSSRDCTTEMI